MAEAKSTAEQTVTHTPGPWHAKFLAPHFVEVCAAEGQPPVIAWGGFDESSVPVKRHEANARLIAAAPLLLSAAKLTVLNFKRNQASGADQGDDEHEAWTALDHAIAIAERRDRMSALYRTSTHAVRAHNRAEQRRLHAVEAVCERLDMIAALGPEQRLPVYESGTSSYQPPIPETNRLQRRRQAEGIVDAVLALTRERATDALEDRVDVHALAERMRRQDELSEDMRGTRQ